MVLYLEKQIHYTLLNLLNHQPDIEKNYLCGKDPYEKKLQQLVNKQEDVVLNNYNFSKVLQNIQMRWMIFMKMLDITICIKSANCWAYLIIWPLICLAKKKKKKNCHIYFLLEYKSKHLSCFYYIIFCCSSKKY